MTIRQSLWAALLLTFVALGARGIAAHFNTALDRHRGVTATTDQFAVPLLHLGNATQILTTALATIPAQESVMIVGQGSDWNFPEFHYLVSYLAWPRPVWALAHGESADAKRFTVLPKDGAKPAAMFFYRIDPPREFASRALPLGPSLFFVPLGDGSL